MVVNEISDLYAGKIIDLLQMKYFRKEKYNNIRWGVSIISKGNNKCEIYFDAFGECGSVNGINVCFEKNEMIGWIKKEIPLLSQKNRWALNGRAIFKDSIGNYYLRMAIWVK